MTAIVTDLDEYRARKMQDAAVSVALSGLTDRQVTTRIVVMDKVLKGDIVLDTVPSFVYDNIFPKGYDPANHPEDNLAALRNEATRRGLEPQ